MACQVVEHRRGKWLWRGITWLSAALMVFILFRFSLLKVYLYPLPQNAINLRTWFYAESVTLGLGYLVFYWFYKKKGFVISSAKSEIFFAYDGFQHDLIEFMDNLEVAMINFTVGTVMIKKQ